VGKNLLKFTENPTDVRKEVNQNGMNNTKVRAIRGVGIDVVDIGRFSQVIERWGERFLRRVFTPCEMEVVAGKRGRARMASLAARFAAKEAFVKAIGTGLRDGLRWTDCEVITKPSGQPQIRLQGKAREKAGSAQVLVSLSHTRQWAVAVVLVCHPAFVEV